MKVHADRGWHNSKHVLENAFKLGGFASSTTACMLRWVVQHLAGCTEEATEQFCDSYICSKYLKDYLRTFVGYS